MIRCRPCMASKSCRTHRLLLIPADIRRQITDLLTSGFAADFECCAADFRLCCLKRACASANFWFWSRICCLSGDSLSTHGHGSMHLHSILLARTKISGQDMRRAKSSTLLWLFSLTDTGGLGLSPLCWTRLLGLECADWRCCRWRGAWPKYLGHVLTHVWQDQFRRHRRCGYWFLP